MSSRSGWGKRSFCFNVGWRVASRRVRMSCRPLVERENVYVSGSFFFRANPNDDDHDPSHGFLLAFLLARLFAASRVLCVVVVSG